MGVHGNGGLSELGVEDDIGGFAPDAGKGLQCLPVCRHLTVMQGQQLCSERVDVTGFGVEKAEALNMRLDSLHTQRDHGLCRRRDGKKIPGTRIDGFVGTLCGKDYGDQQLKRGAIV